MAQFHWKETSPQPCCICSSPSHPRGFVDMVGDINVVREGYEITGVVDMMVCGGCLEQSARLIGCASRQEVEEFAYREVELATELEKTRDEVVSERQRHEQFLNNLYKEAGKAEATESKQK